MNITALIEQFDAWRTAGSTIALATVTKTAGSTYSKPGTHMLFSGQSDYRGLLSGGCLEGDLLERAQPVLISGDPAHVVYDMRDQEQDQLWGLGLGCNGMMEVLIQRLAPETGYQPFAAITDQVRLRVAGHYAIAVDGKQPGAGLVWGPGDRILHQLSTAQGFRNLPDCPHAATCASVNSRYGSRRPPPGTAGRHFRMGGGGF